MCSDTENAIDTLFNTISNRIQQAIETSNEKRSGFTHKSVALLYYYFEKIDIKRGKLYIMSPDWIVSKKATINPKNQKDNECFKWSIIAGLNDNKITEKELKKKGLIQIFPKENGKNLNKTILSLLLISYLYHTTNQIIKNVKIK